MKVLIIYCHPYNESFTNKVKEAFIRGLIASGHNYEISDLYEMNFNAEFTKEEYLREAFYQEDVPLSEDVLQEQAKIQDSDIIVFIYPVFWTEAPVKLVGWFDRVWSCGFAYGQVPKIKILDKALFVAITGKTIETLNETGEAEAMRVVMLGDRIRHRAIEKEMVFLDGTSHYNEEIRKLNCEKHIKIVYELGKNL